MEPIITEEKGNLQEITVEENYVFTFTRKSTGAAIRVQTRPTIFPDGFFEQRGIVEFGIPREATEEERRIFETWERGVRDKFMSFSEEELFTFE